MSLVRRSERSDETRPDLSLLLQPRFLNRQHVSVSHASSLGSFSLSYKLFSPFNFSSRHAYDPRVAEMLVYLSLCFLLAPSYIIIENVPG